MSTLYEYYNTGDDSLSSFYGVLWRAQTFTPALPHKITSVKLLLYRIGSPGTLTVSIKATDESDHPTGDDLCSGTTNGNTLPTDSPYEWREITLGDGYNLSESTKYAIVVRALTGGSSDYISWRRDTTTPDYSDGCHEYSINSGSSWTSDADSDFMFEDWGEVAVTAKTSSDSGSGMESIHDRTLSSLEQGGGVDTQSLLSCMTGSDIATGLDALMSLMAAIISSETGIGVEASELFAELIEKYSSDSGIGTELSKLTGKLVKSRILALMASKSSMKTIMGSMVNMNVAVGSKVSMNTILKGGG